jgi:hypothetical protein
MITRDDITCDFRGPHTVVGELNLRVTHNAITGDFGQGPDRLPAIHGVQDAILDSIYGDVRENAESLRGAFIDLNQEGLTTREYQNRIDRFMNIVDVLCNTGLTIEDNEPTIRERVINAGRRGNGLLGTAQAGIGGMGPWTGGITRVGGSPLNPVRETPPPPPPDPSRLHPNTVAEINSQLDAMPDLTPAARRVAFNNIVAEYITHLPTQARVNNRVTRPLVEPDIYDLGRVPEAMTGIAQAMTQHEPLMMTEEDTLPVPF